MTSHTCWLDRCVRGVEMQCQYNVVCDVRDVLKTSACPAHPKRFPLLIHWSYKILQKQNEYFEKPSAVGMGVGENVLYDYEVASDVTDVESTGRDIIFRYIIVKRTTWIIVFQTSSFKLFPRGNPGRANGRAPVMEAWSCRNVWETKNNYFLSETFSTYRIGLYRYLFSVIRPNTESVPDVPISGSFGLGGNIIGQSIVLPRPPTHGSPGDHPGDISPHSSWMVFTHLSR